MVASALVPVIGSFLEKGLDANPKDILKVATAGGFLLSITRGDIEAAHIVQNSPDPKYSVYKLFLIPSAQVNVAMSATTWTEVDSLADRLRSIAADSGASKRIEDTA